MHEMKQRRMKKRPTVFAEGLRGMLEHEKGKFRPIVCLEIVNGAVAVLVVHDDERLVSLSHEFGLNGTSYRSFQKQLRNYGFKAATGPLCGEWLFMQDYAEWHPPYSKIYIKTEGTKITRVADIGGISPVYEKGCTEHDRHEPIELGNTQNHEVGVLPSDDEWVLVHGLLQTDDARQSLA